MSARGQPIRFAGVSRSFGAVRALPSADWANYLHCGSFDFALKAGRPDSR